MKKTLTLIAVLAASAMTAFAADYTVDFAKVAAQKHPRLLMNAEDFKTEKKIVSSRKNEALNLVHKSLVDGLDNMTLENKKLHFEPDGVKNPLEQARQFLRYAIIASYNYRYTKDKTFVFDFEPIIEHYCDNFDGWMKETPIDAFIIHTEYAMGLAFAYDWMFDVLKPSLKKRMEEQMRAHVLECKWNESDGNNRSQVCNASYMACAVAMAEKLDAAAMADKMKFRIENLRKTMSLIYDADGASNESASYWSYGADFQAFALAVLEKAFGTDFDLMNTSGFRKTLKYRTFTVDNLGGFFDFGDCNKSVVGSPCVFYYAWKFGEPDSAYGELQMLREKGYKYNREAILAVIGAMGLGAEFSPVQSTDKFYQAVSGRVPLVIARTGFGRTDAYAGLKGGSPLDPHGHMDIGTFTYEAYGFRWASDYHHYAYQRHRNILKKINAPKDRKKIDYPGWDFFHMNNRQHNTLTVNGHNQVPTASARMIETLDRGNEWGGTLDMTPCYALDLSKAVRSIVLREDQTFDVKDCVTANENGEAVIRWTLCTLAKPEITPEGIILTQGGVRMLLKTDAPGVEYKTWPNDPGAYPETPVGKIEAEQKLRHPEFSFAGFVFTLAPGASADVTTTFRKL